MPGEPPLVSLAPDAQSVFGGASAKPQYSAPTMPAHAAAQVPAQVPAQAPSAHAPAQAPESQGPGALATLKQRWTDFAGNQVAVALVVVVVAVVILWWVRPPLVAKGGAAAVAEAAADGKAAPPDWGRIGLGGAVAGGAVLAWNTVASWRDTALPANAANTLGAITGMGVPAPMVHGR
jgi:hypothetical protein